MSIFTRFKKAIRGEWRYKGVTNRFMNRHTWTNGVEKVNVYYMDGAGHHAGFVAEVTGGDHDARLQLTNGFADNLYQGMVLADLYIREDTQAPAAFMHSDDVESDKGPGSLIRQDEWLQAHAKDYEFEVIDPDIARR